VGVDGLGNFLVHDKFGHGIWDLLEQDRSEPGVESTNTFVLQDLAEAREETRSEVGLGDQADTGSLQWAKGNIGKKFSKCRRSKVDSRSVLGSGLISLLCRTHEDLITGLYYLAEGKKCSQEC